MLVRLCGTSDAAALGHYRRTGAYSRLLADALGMSRSFCDEIAWAAQFHDVGKASVDPALLAKRGELSAAERVEIERHPAAGHAVLEPLDGMSMAAEIALRHHEKWDGGGYPNGLAGEALPIAARIVAVADVYDALRSPRPYKPSYDHTRACSIMRYGDHRLDAEGHFDPRLLALFLDNHRAFDAVWRRDNWA